MSSKTDVAVKLALVFFISLLSFSVGTFVGKKYSDNQHQLAALEPQNTAKPFAEREVASVEGEDVKTHKEEANEVMSDEELAKLAAEFATDETDSSAHNTATAAHKEATTLQPSAIAEKLSEETHAAVPEKNVAVNTHKAANAHAAVKAPAATTTASAVAPKVNAHVETKTEERLPSSLPKDVANFSVGKFTVQIASYADETEAKAKASDLKESGYAAFYIPANIKGKVWYRVSVGQFATQKEAQNYRNKLLSSSKVNSAIVQKITE